MREEFLSRSPEETREYARRFAATLRPGHRLCLSGDLGAGKTEFMRGIAGYFGCEADLSSPTFSLFNIYTGSFLNELVELYHFDLYRIERPEDLGAIGFEEYLFGPNIAVVEWGDRFEEYRSVYTVTVRLDHADGNVRRIVITR